MGKSEIPVKGKSPSPKKGQGKGQRVGHRPKDRAKKKTFGRKEVVFLPGLSAFASVCVSACPPVSVPGCPGGRVFLAFPCLFLESWFLPSLFPDKCRSESCTGANLAELCQVSPAAANSNGCFPTSMIMSTFWDFGSLYQ